MLETRTSFGPRRRADPGADVDGDPANVVTDRARTRPCAARPARRGPAAATPSLIAQAHSIARAGPSKVARKPSPSVLISRPRNRSSWRRVSVVVAFDQLSPAPVARLGRALGRINDVGEQHRRKDPVERPGLPGPGQELLDLVRGPSRSPPTNTRWSGSSNSTSLASGILSAISRAPSTGATRSPVRWRIRVGTPDRRQDVANVDLEQRFDHRLCHRGAARWHAGTCPRPRELARILGGAGSELVEQRALAPRGRGLADECLHLLVGRPPRDVGVGAESAAWSHRAPGPRFGPGRWPRTGRSRGPPPISRTAPRAPTPAASITACMSSIRCSERWRPGHRVGQAGAPLVEDHHPGERAEALKQLGDPAGISQ